MSRICALFVPKIPWLFHYFSCPFTWNKINYLGNLEWYASGAKVVKMEFSMKGEHSPPNKVTCRISRPRFYNTKNPIFFLEFPWIYSTSSESVTCSLKQTSYVCIITLIAMIPHFKFACVIMLHCMCHIFSYDHNQWWLNTLFTCRI